MKRTLDSFFQPASKSNNDIAAKKLRGSPPGPGLADRGSGIDLEEPSPIGYDSSGSTTTAGLATIDAATNITTAVDADTAAAIILESGSASHHPTYPFPIPDFSQHLEEALSAECPAKEGRTIAGEQLDLLYFQPFLPRSLAREVFEFLREELFFYRVAYSIKRGGKDVSVSTPRYTTVFGVDQTATFSSPSATSNHREDNDLSSAILIDAKTQKPLPRDTYRTCRPRPIPRPLDLLRRLSEVFTGSTYNFCLVNFYASGNDSISYHSDDERFLGSDPAIASFSLGEQREFLMKKKPPPAPASASNGPNEPNLPAPAPATASSSSSSSSLSPSNAAKPLRFELASGDMLLMRGPTQANWLHSVPKRKAVRRGEGRINITFRKALIRGGTENYYRYNVGTGEPWKWDPRRREIVQWKQGSKVGGQ